MKDSEREIKQKIRRYLKKIKFSKFVSYSPYPYGEPGTPDYVGCWNGKMYLIEVKQEGKGLSPIQKVRCNEWLKAGAVVLIAHSVNDIKNIIKEE